MQDQPDFGGTHQDPAPRIEEDGPTLAEFEPVLPGLATPLYSFALYVSGSSARSLRAIANVRRLCNEYLPGRYELRVVDAFQQPEKVREARIVALPTLVKQGPNPPSRFVGDMAEIDKIVLHFRLKTRREELRGEGARQKERAA